MIPCYSLFLEVEIPDPDLNYFIISQNELDNTEKLLAPPPLGTPSQADTRAGVPFPYEILTQQTFDYDPLTATGPPEGSNFVSWDGESACPPLDATLYGTPTSFYILHYRDTGENIYYDAENNRFIQTFCFITYDEEREVVLSFTQTENQNLTNTIIYHETIPGNKWVEMEVALPDDLGISQLNIYPEWIDDLNGGFISCPFYVSLPVRDCESGLNTFVLGASCLDGTIDLLEGWGAARPDYKWVDVITDTTDIELQRGFDMKQGIVGTPIAGVMEANILDPYLEGIETSKIAVGQRVRLRAGNQVVFSGVASVVRSEYDAVNTPTLRIEAVDALGLLNAQMVSERPQELYNTRLAEAASKVELPIQQQESTTMLNPTEDPMSALELLVETQDSEGSVVWLDRFGTLYSTNRYWLSIADDLPVFRNSNFDKVPRFTFTNNPSNENEEIGIGSSTEQVCLSAYKQVADTSQVINGITFYNYTEEEEEGLDENGNPIIEKVIVRDTYTFESANSRRLYGDAGVKLTTYLPPTDLVGYADYVFANYDTPKTKVETIQFPLDKWKSLEVPEMVSIDIGDPVKVRIDDPLTQHTLNRATQRVAQIRHRITPTEWLCELDLL